MMRFYFEDHVAGNVATKCLRISSTTTTGEVIETLSEKFRPDMKMLNTPYFLFEVHANKGKMDGWMDTLIKEYTWGQGICEQSYILNRLSVLSGKFVHVTLPLFALLTMAEERQLDLSEKPLVVQLNWNTHNREGRFVLKKDKDIIVHVTDCLLYL